MTQSIERASAAANMSSRIIKGLFWLMPAASLVPVFGQGQFAQQGPKLTPTEAAAVTNAGNSVSISGDGNIAIVGGSLSAGRAAAAWIYTRTSGTWTQAGAALSGSAQ